MITTPFNNYLDAARYCRQAGISHEQIEKLGQSQYVVRLS